jgi:hypothetical protein
VACGCPCASLAPAHEIFRHPRTHPHHGRRPGGVGGRAGRGPADHGADAARRSRTAPPAGAVARQLAASAEYSLFVGNAAALDALVQAACREPDVHAAAFLDAQGRVLASTVPREQISPLHELHAGFSAPAPGAAAEHWHAMPVHATQLNVIDPYTAPSGDAPPLGHLLLKATTRSLHEEIHAYALQAAAHPALILVISVALANAFFRGLSAP